MVSQIYDKFIIAERSNKTIALNLFLTPQYWFPLERFLQGYKMPYKLEGFFEESERRLLIFNYSSDFDIPAVILHIKNKSKFVALKHKDYLGAILALGLERDSLGDLVVYEEGAYVSILSDISKYVIYNLQSIGKNPCEIEVLEDKTEIPQIKKEEFEIIVTSRRLDNFISSLCKLSRADSIKLIEQGRVLVDYIEIKEKSFEVKNGSTITIRGYGKFNVYGTVKNTKSNRQVVAIKKFI